MKIYILNRTFIEISTPQLRRAGAFLEHGLPMERRVYVRGPRLLRPQRTRDAGGGGHQSLGGRGVQVQSGLQVSPHQEHPGQCHSAG